MGNTLSNDELDANNTKGDSETQSDKPKSDKKKRRPRTLRRKIMEYIPSQPEAEEDLGMYGDFPGNNPQPDTYTEPPPSEPVFSTKRKRRQFTYKSRNY